MADLLQVHPVTVARWECDMRILGGKRLAMLNDIARQCGIAPLAPPRGWRRRRPYIVVGLPPTWREKGLENEGEF